MKKLKQLLAALLSVAIVVPMYAMNVSAAGEVYINSTNFPDANFREKVSDECDTNGDGMLSTSEINAVTGLRVYNLGISDLTGINYFTNLTALECSLNNLTSLDVSNLTNLIYLACSENNLTSLDVSGCTSLAIFYSYWAYSNVITNLVLTGINTTIEATLLS